MKYVFYIVALCVSVHAVTFTYVKANKLWAIENETMELEDITEESDGQSEEDTEDAREHCPFYQTLTENVIFAASLSVRTVPADEFRISHIPSVECPPPKI